MIIKNIQGYTLVETHHKTIRAAVEWCVEKGVDLSGADLRKAKLTRASLDGLKAGGACLWGADFTGADVGYSDLRQADLRCASFKDSCLSEANMTGADLQGAYFSGTLLDGANLANATLSCPSIWDCNIQLLGNFKGLVYRHRGETDVTLHRLPIVVRGLGKRLVIFSGYCLWGHELYRAGEMPDSAQSTLFSLKTLVEKAMQPDHSRYAKKPMRKIYSGAAAS